MSLPDNSEEQAQFNTDFAEKLKSAVSNAESGIGATPVHEDTHPPEEQETEASDTEATPEVTEPATELRSKQLAAIARRERELREREEALKQREAAPPPESQEDEYTPEFDLASLKDPLDIQAVAIYMELGTDAPKEILDRVTQLRYEQRFNRMETGTPTLDEDAIRQRVADETVTQMKINEIHSVVDSGIPSDYPLLAAEAQEEPQGVKQAIANYMDAVRQAENRWCSTTEAIKAINDELVAYAEKLDRYRNVKPATAKPTPTGDPTSHEAPLSTAELSSTPDRSTEELEMDIDKRIAMAKSKLGFN